MPRVCSGNISLKQVVLLTLTSMPVDTKVGLGGMCVTSLPCHIPARRWLQHGCVDEAVHPCDVHAFGSTCNMLFAALHGKNTLTIC